MGKALVAHATASIFPLMSGDEFDALKADIAEHGQREPITLLDERILDGRNRYRACQELKLDPKTRELRNGQSPVAFVKSANLHRRHLTGDQYAACAIDAESFADGERRAAKERQKTAIKERDEKGRAKPLPQIVGEVDAHAGEVDERLAKEFGTNREYVRTARKIKAEAPKLFEAVKRGEMKLPEAKRQLSPPPKPKSVPISKTFGDHLSEIRQVLSGIRGQYGNGAKMLASPLWQKCDTSYAIEMTGMLVKLLGQLHKEMMQYVESQKK